MPESSKPAVSIILPTYNRASFLPEAFAAIRNQQWTDWELIVVDDGSSDNTRELIVELTKSWPQSVRYHYQENQGAYGARNTGLDHATGKYIAFYDSDDLWLPHHLKDCAEALDAHTDVDWVFGACRTVHLQSLKTIAPSTFYVNNTPRPFMSLTHELRSRLIVITDSRAIDTLIVHGFFCGLQNSLIRRSVFSNIHFDAPSRNEGEDVLAAISAAAIGVRFAYYDSVHVDYFIHNSNSSAAGGSDRDRSLRIFTTAINRMCILLDSNQLDPHASQLMRKHIARHLFWSIGYSIHWKSKQTDKAFDVFAKAIRMSPANLGFWKTYVACKVKHYLGMV